MPSLKQTLLDKARSEWPNWINGGRYEFLAMELGRKASNCSRRLRELENAGLLERRLNGKSVEYRYIKQLAREAKQEPKIMPKTLFSPVK